MSSTSFCLPSPSTVIHPYTVGISVNELLVRGLETKQNKTKQIPTGLVLSVLDLQYISYAKVAA